MEFFVDTANRDEIKDLMEMGIIDGVTTNPTLIAREVERTGDDPEKIYADILSMVPGPVSLEVISLDWKGMVEEAKRLAQKGENVVVKIPMTSDGLKAVKILHDEGIKTNVTLVFSPLQALLAAKAGATFVSPFVGRLDDHAQDGMELVEEIVTIYQNYGFDTKVLVASVRNPIHVLRAALVGADVATVPYRVLLQFIKHPKTDEGIERFLKDWEKVNKK